jgi:ferredoxin-nitrite reductase
MADKHGHIGVHPQKQAGLNYLGVVLPVGRITRADARPGRDRERFGSGTLRLTVWQNLLISDVADATSASASPRCRRWASASRRAPSGAALSPAPAMPAASSPPPTPRAMRCSWPTISRRGRGRPAVNIHLTGCHHSCAQHYVGDIGLLAQKIERGERAVEGYHVYIGGGAAATGEQAMAREYALSVPFDELPRCSSVLLGAWLAHRTAPAGELLRVLQRTQSPTARGVREAGAAAGGGMNAIRPLPSIVPENAPFSTVQQRAWLNGFFAAYLGLEVRIGPGPTSRG